MIPKVKTYNFTATRRASGLEVRGIVAAPNKILARLNVSDASGYTLCDIKIGGVKRKLTEEEKKSWFLVHPS